MFSHYEQQQQQQHYHYAQPPQQQQMSQYTGNVFSDVLAAPVGRYNAQWLWLDLECSGLEPTAANFGILEIAAAITNEDLNIIETFHVVVHQPQHILNTASRWCIGHFGSRSGGGNDLFEQSRASAITEAVAGEMLEAFIVKHAKMRRVKVSDAMCVPTTAAKRDLFKVSTFGDVTLADEEPKPAPRASGGGQQHDFYRVMLAGCSCYFDRAVILARFPNLRKYVAHKIIDTTSVLEIARRWRPDVLQALPPAASGHRALPDVLESIALMVWFMRTVLYARPVVGPQMHMMH